MATTGSGTASHCSAQIQTPLGAYYQSLSPPVFSLEPKAKRPIRFGFQDAGLRNVHDGKFLVRCGDFFLGADTASGVSFGDAPRRMAGHAGEHVAI